MSLELAIQENTAALRELIAAIGKGIPTPAAQVNAVVQEAAASKKTSPKAEKAETSAVVEEKPAALTQMTAAEAEKALDGHANRPAEAATYQDAAAAITELAKTKGKPAAVEVLGKFGAAKLPEVKPEDFGNVIAACRELLGA